MIDAVYGSLTRINEHSIVLHCGFLDFSISVSALTAGYFASLSEAEKEHVKMYTYLQHREDAMILFGFRDRQERRIFTEILTVQGIGPKQALKILSGISPNDFIKALDAGDLGVLTAIPGLGTKTAQKIVLALRNKLALEGKEPDGADGTTVPQERKLLSDIIQSLADMGYDKREARTAVEQAAASSADFQGTAEEREKRIFTQALIALG